MTFCSCNTPNIVTVLPAMNLINRKLTTDAISGKYCVAIRTSLEVARCTLNHYYNKTDYSELYRITMSESTMIIHT